MANDDKPKPGKIGMGPGKKSVEQRNGGKFNSSTREKAAKKDTRPKPPKPDTTKGSTRRKK